MIPYPGGELELFRLARNWKRYWSGVVRPLVRGRVADVGAGLGENVPLLSNEAVAEWLCLEPDADLASRIRARIDSGELPPKVRVVVETLGGLPGEDRFDTILYLDVLEHIEDDRAELERAAARLAPGGRLVVLAPAHSWLFSEFDAAIGHYRRYERRTLAGVAPAALKAESIRYLDSLGLLLSLGNRWLTRQRLPTERQILFWDRTVVPVSRLVDRILGGQAGKSVLGIWRKEDGQG